MTGDDEPAFELSASQRAAFSRRAGRVATNRLTVPDAGGLTAERLRSGMLALADQLEILRTRFERAPGVSLPLQVVGASCEMSEVAGGVVLGTGDAVVGARVTPTGGAELWASETIADHLSLARLAELLTGRAELEDEPLQFADFAGWEAEQAGSRSPEQRQAAHFWAAEDTATAMGTGGAHDAADVPAATADRVRWLVAFACVLQRDGLLERGAARLTVRVDGRHGDDLATAIGPYARDLPLPLGALLHRTPDQASDDVAAALADAEQFAVFAPDVELPVRFRWLPAGASETAEQGDGFAADAQVTLTVVDGGAARVTVQDGLIPARLLAEHVTRLLTAMSNEPGRTLDELPMLTDAELRTLRDLGRRPPPAARSRSLLEAFDRAVANHPGRVAVRGVDEEVTYEALAERVAAVAASLRDRRLAEGPVAVTVDRRADTVVAILTAMRCGVPFVPVREDLPPARRDSILDRAGVGVILKSTQPAGTPSTNAGERAVVTVAELAASTTVSSSPVPSPASSAGALYLMATSGSTGIPKLVEVGPDNAACYAAAVAERLALPDGCVLGVATSLATDLAYTMLFPAWVRAGTVCLLAEDTVADAAQLDRAVADLHIDAVKLTPSLLRAVLAGDDAQLRVPLLVLGGEALTGRDVARARAAGAERVVNHYGPTETTVGATTHDATDGADDGPVPIGVPLPGVRVAVLDPQHQLVSPGVLGELAIAGPGVSRGYSGDTERTAEVFVPAWDGDGLMYLTGDRARWDRDGRLVFHGRGDGQVKIRGFRVELGDIEHTLRSLPGIVDAAVVVDAGDENADRLRAYVSTGGQPPGDLLAELGSRLPAYMVPATVTALPSLPRLPNGKLDAAALPAPASDAAVSAAADTDTERELLALWEEALGRTPIGVDDDFFYLGGHSLLATRIIARARSAFSVDLPLHVIFSSPTVRTMAADIDARRAADLESHADGPDTTADDIESLIDSLESMSDDEAQALLDAELGKRSRPEHA